MPGTLSSAIEHQRAGRLDEAEAAFRELVTRDPRDADTFVGLGEVLERLGRPGEARVVYGQAVTLDPANAAAQLRLGLVSLLFGDYGAGWRGYEWRADGRETAATLRTSSPPRWDGSDPAGQTILVHCEPGLGDCVQFARYLPLLSGRGADVVLVCPRPLVRLFGSLPGVCVVADGDPPPRADARVAIGSLPLMFGTTPATIPTFGAYLRPDVRLSTAWRERLRPLRADGRKLIGLCFAGDEASNAVAPAHLAPLADLPRARFIHLPAGPGAAWLTDAKVLNLAHEPQDFADVAAVLGQVDLVVADSSSCVAHLAGALGRRCWTLVPFAPDWRWALTGDDTPWYPSLRLFRQPGPGDWASVAADLLQAMKQELALSPAPLAA